MDWNEDLKVPAKEQFLLPLNWVFILFLNKVKAHVKYIFVLLKLEFQCRMKV